MQFFYVKSEVYHRMFLIFAAVNEAEKTNRRPIAQAKKYGNLLTEGTQTKISLLPQFLRWDCEVHLIQTS